MEAVLAPYAGKSEFPHTGQRVVVGQRLMQAASDMFLGWTRYRGHDYYVRQFRDMKGSVNLDTMTPSGFASCAEICGRTPARAHAWSGDAATIAGYTGTAERGSTSRSRHSPRPMASKSGVTTRLWSPRPSPAVSPRPGVC